MLPRTQRLTRAEFLATKHKKKLFHSPVFLVSVTYSETLKGAVVVSKKVARGAVERNRIRRRMYAVLQDVLKMAQNNAHIVIVAKKGIETTSFDELHNELTHTLTEAQILAQS